MGRSCVETKKTENDTETVTEYECAACKATREERVPKVIYGYVNGDSKVNAKYVICIMRYLVGWIDEDINIDLADYNKDGKANSRNVIMSLIYIVTKVNK